MGERPIFDCVRTSVAYSTLVYKHNFLSIHHLNLNFCSKCSTGQTSSQTCTHIHHLIHCLHSVKAIHCSKSNTGQTHIYHPSHLLLELYTCKSCMYPSNRTKNENPSEDRGELTNPWLFMKRTLL